MERARRHRRGRRRDRSKTEARERSGLDAVPIVCMLSFLVGAVVAFLGATVLADFGAQVFTVELVSYSFMREFGVLLTAIMIAGRSGSAYTAEIGMMRAREEIDAIRALGLDPIELLVIPRLRARRRGSRLEGLCRPERKGVRRSGNFFRDPRPA